MQTTMAKGKRDGLLIAGGGLAGCLVALAMAKARPDVPLLLVEGSETFGRPDRTWTFLESDIDPADRWLLEPLITASWPGYYVAFPGQSRNFKAPVHAISAERLDAVMRETLRPDQYRLGTRVVAVRDNELVLPGGEKLRGDAAVDARGATNLSLLDLGWRLCLGRTYRFAAPHGLDRPVLIDATIEGAGFFRCLPLAEDRMLVEYVDHGATPESGLADAGARIDAYLQRRRWIPAEVESEQQAQLPLPLGGDFNAFWRVGGARVAKLGIRGGFFHPATGAALPDAVGAAILLAGQRTLDGAALHDLFEEEASLLWKKREYYRSYNSQLFALPPQARAGFLERLYRLDPAVIARFHAARAGLIDRRRISAALKA
jgi:lycopene beta-cyclase